MAWDFFTDGLAPDNSLAVTTYGYEAFGDDPADHRWRAWWGADGGIYLRCYPVVGTTPEGVWIAQHAYWNGSDWKNMTLRRWVKNGSGSAWAKPTKEDAIVSIAARLTRWIQRDWYSRERLKSAIYTMRTLRPDLAAHLEPSDHLFADKKP